jgi:Fe2+ transport system protein FeoA
MNASAMPTHDPRSIPLSQLTPGQRGQLAESQLDEADGPLLRAMGLRPDCELRVCRVGSPCIVTLETGCGGGCRIGIARDIADRVLVRPSE